MIKLREVVSKKDLKQFILLPYSIHKNHKEWLPPLISDEWKVFDKRKNHSFEHCDAILLLAEKNQIPVGRIMGIINHTYNTGHNEKNARFCFAECYNDSGVFNALMEAVEQWAKEKGMKRLVGPLGFSDKDPQGFLIKGYSDPMTVIVTNCSLPYMVDFTEQRGYKKKLDLFQYRSKVPENVPENYAKIAERALSRGYRILEFNKSKNVRPYVKPVFDLINETYIDIYGFAPLLDIESKEFSERFLPLLDPEFIKIVVDTTDNVVAFVVAMPDISEGFRKANGRLFPFGFIHIINAFIQSGQLNLLLGCVKTNLQGSGLHALMAVSMYESANRANLKLMDSHLIMEENVRMRALMERHEHEIYKKYRVFEKDLQSISISNIS